MDLIKVSKLIASNKFLIETTFQLEKYFLNIVVNFDIQKPAQDYKQLFLFISLID